MAAEIGPGVQAEYIGQQRPDLRLCTGDVRTVVAIIGGGIWMCVGCGPQEDAIMVRDTPSGADSGLWCRCAWRPLFDPSRSSVLERLRREPTLEPA